MVIIDIGMIGILVQYGLGMIQQGNPHRCLGLLPFDIDPLFSIYSCYNITSL